MINSNSQPLVINCLCGTRIALSQDPTKTGQIIREHANHHVKDMKNMIESEKEANRIQDFLIKQVFQIVIEH